VKIYSCIGLGDAKKNKKKQEPQRNSHSKTFPLLAIIYAILIQWVFLHWLAALLRRKNEQKKRKTRPGAIKKVA